jgi:arylsulfatase A-like enzyme
VIVVVTGDHGLRYAAEYSSFGFATHEGNLDFNVPFLLYAPGLIDRRIDLPYSTSHIDIAPTLYFLLGIPTDSLHLHGENMLDRRLEDRATFLMNTGIYPVDGFEFKTHRFSANTITNEVHISPPPTSSESPAYHFSDKTIRSSLTAANHVFNLTAAEFLTRAGASPQVKRANLNH